MEEAWQREREKKWKLNPTTVSVKLTVNKISKRWRVNKWKIILKLFLFHPDFPDSFDISHYYQMQGKIHFDCLHVVYFCLSYSLSSPFKLSINISFYSWTCINYTFYSAFFELWHRYGYLTIKFPKVQKKTY